MPTVTFRFRGPNVRLAGALFGRLLERIVRQIAHAIEAELVKLSPGSGNLINAWDVAVIKRRGSPVGLVINDYRTPTGLVIMFLLEGGTGIYGPTGEPIRPREKRALKFEIGGEVFIRREVKGIDPEKHAFVEKALEAAKPEIDAIIQRESRAWYVPEFGMSL